MSEQWSTPVQRTRRAGPRRLRWVLPLVVAVLAAAAGTVVAIARGGPGGTPAAGSRGTATPGVPGTQPPAPSTGAHPSPAATTRPAAPARTVRVTTALSDGATYGVGMPIIVFFSPPPRDAAAFERNATVTVDGRPAGGAWYWVPPTRDQLRQHVAEAHYRPPAFWPAHSRVHLDVHLGGRPAGPGLVFGDRFTSLDFAVGAEHVSTVEPGGLHMRVTSDGRVVRTLPVSLGAAATPTYTGTKIVMQKGETAPGTNRLRPDGTVLMSGPGYTDHPVPWSVRITRSGEYVHAASWNHAIGERSTSNGCTNLTPADAKWFYGFSRLGDVVTYPSTDGGPMPTWDGVRDWNVPWSQWRTGGPARPGA